MNISTIEQTEKAKTLNRAALASFLGNFIEWFDYASYGYLATTIAVVFFPQENKTAALMNAFAIFALSFLLRPIGAIIWGNLGDRFGRRWALSWSILIMSGATFLVGCLPGYISIGLAAPLLLLLLRLIQGFSASGEYAGAATFLAEYAPVNKRGLYTSIVPASTATGLLVGSLMVAAMTATMSDASLQSWGWRIPFLLALPLGWIGRYIRVHLEDSPVYAQMIHDMHETKGKLTTPSPVRDVFKHSYRSLAIGFGVASLNAVAFYVVLVYLPTYLTEVVGVSKGNANLASTISLAAYIFAIFAMGHISDTFGRKKMLITACLGFIIFTIPLFMVLQYKSFILVVLVTLALCFMLTINDGTLSGFLTESFPTEVRYTGFAISFNLANAIFGGTAPFICTWLTDFSEKTLNLGQSAKLAPAAYLITISVLALGAMIASKDHTGKDLANRP